jgi:hypothetical protein
LPAAKPQLPGDSKPHADVELEDPGVNTPHETGRTDELEPKPFLPPQHTVQIPKPDRKLMRKTLREMRAGNVRRWTPK